MIWPLMRMSGTTAAAKARMACCWPSLTPKPKAASRLKPATRTAVTALTMDAASLSMGLVLTLRPVPGSRRLVLVVLHLVEEDALWVEHDQMHLVGKDLRDDGGAVDGRELAVR